MEGSGENWPYKYEMMDMNKLEKAINYYVWYLEERVRDLEKKKTETMSSGAAEACRAYNNDDGDDEEWCEAAALPEVRARVSENEVLIIIHCEKQKGIMHKILSHLETLNLSVISSSVLPFGKFTLDITIVAQMGEEFRTMVISGIVKSLRRAICK